MPKIQAGRRIRYLAVLKRGRLAAAAAHVLRKTLDAVSIMSFAAKLLPIDVPVSPLTCTRCLHVRRLLARLPSAGHDQRACHRRALRAVDVLRVAEADT